MSSKKNSVVVDGDGISVGTEMSEKRTVAKTFDLSSKSADWPLDGEGSPLFFEDAERGGGTG